jgi:hypothetical protein
MVGWRRLGLRQLLLRLGRAVRPDRGFIGVIPSEAEEPPHFCGCWSGWFVFLEGRWLYWQNAGVPFDFAQGGFSTPALWAFGRDDTSLAESIVYPKRL